jgi:hypothetical protein
MPEGCPPGEMPEDPPRGNRAAAFRRHENRRQENRRQENRRQENRRQENRRQEKLE